MGNTPQFNAELVGNSLIVWDYKQASELYQLGFYGKPVGIAKPKSVEFETPLVIDLIEGLYLLEKKIIKVYKGPKKRNMGIKRFHNYAEKTYRRFKLDYIVYKNLRNHGYIVLPGIKFGCEFAVYERGPGIDHAPYMISVRAAEDEITSTDIVRAGRLATSVRKRFIIAIPNLITETVQYLMFKWFKA
jgi:tRNA-intron endonuclease